MFSYSRDELEFSRHLPKLATNNRPKVVNIIYTGIPNWIINLTQYPWVWNIPGVALSWCKCDNVWVNPRRGSSVSTSFRLFMTKETSIPPSKTHKNNAASVGGGSRQRTTGFARNVESYCIVQVVSKTTVSRRRP